MAKKVYIATPVNSRSEATLEEKREAAYKRIKEIEYRLSKAVKGYEFAEFHSSFDDDIAPIDLELTKKMFGMGLPSESVIMGKCVQRVMECDVIVLDNRWSLSRGCNLERFAALKYGKDIHYVTDYDIEPKNAFVKL